MAGDGAVVSVGVVIGATHTMPVVGVAGIHLGGGLILITVLAGDGAVITADIGVATIQVGDGAALTPGVEIMQHVHTA